jgi:hypothetical protein
MAFCLPINLFIGMAISCIPYQLLAVRQQSTGRHFVHGIIGGLWYFALTNFLGRCDNLQFPPSVGVSILLGSILIPGILLGFLSRRDAKEQEHGNIIDEPPAQ